MSRQPARLRDSWLLSRAPRDLLPLPGGSSGTTFGVPTGGLIRSALNPRLLASSSETPLDGGTPRALPKQDMGSASLGVRPLAPLHRMTERVSTPPDLPGPKPGRAWPRASRSRRTWDRPKPVPGADGATRLPRSALVVSHHLDGFLHSHGCRLVASCYRSWGSPAFPAGRFRVPTIHRSGLPRPGRAPAIPAARFGPSEEFPSSAAAPHRCGRCLLAVGYPPRG